MLLMCCRHVIGGIGIRKYVGIAEVKEVVELIRIQRFRILGGIESVLSGKVVGIDELIDRLIIALWLFTVGLFDESKLLMRETLAVRV